MGGEGLRTAAVIDGTAPHTRDPILPGAAEEIINLGDFWDEGMLEKRRGELSALMKEKSALFSEAFEYLFAAGEITRMLRSDARALHAAGKDARRRRETHRSGVGVRPEG